MSSDSVLGLVLMMYVCSLRKENGVLRNADTAKVRLHFTTGIRICVVGNWCFYWKCSMSGCQWFLPSSFAIVYVDQLFSS